MKIIGIIPARYESLRFPGKPLLDIRGRSMISRVYSQAQQCAGFEEILVATDDQKIYRHCLSVGISVIMTSSSHRSGTDRVAEVARQREAEVIVNIQGDEPFIPPSHLDVLVSKFDQPEVQLATLAAPLIQEDRILNSSVVKLVKRSDNRALYFSRAGIPFDRNDEGTSYWQHLGVYAYRRSALLEITQLSPSPLELTEGLEQLRWLEAGYDIHVVEVDRGTIGIDTQHDVQRLLSWMDEHGLD